MSARKIFGKNTVRELLRHKPERLLKLHLLGDAKDWQAWLETCQVQGRKLKLEYHRQKQGFEHISGPGNHQGVCAEVEELPQLLLEDSVKELTQRPSSRLLLLDCISDAQNFGAILRAAECFGIDGVIYPKDRSADINAGVSKSSVGASELVPLYKVTNLKRALELLKKSGYWTYAAHLDGKAQPLAQTEFMPHSALVLGSEEKGPRSGVLAACDFQVLIEMKGRIDSLNVSQAAAVLCYALSQRKTP